MTVERAVELIKSEEYKEDIERLRRATDKNIRAVIKKGLDYFTFSGTFKARSADQLIQHSGIICLDIDDLQEMELQSLKLSIIQDPLTLACFLSPSGTGLKILIKLNPVKLSPMVHLQSFLALEKYFLTKYNVELDKSGKDIPRACFVSFDPLAFLNLNSDLFKLSEADQEPVSLPSKQATPVTTSMLPADFSTNEALTQARFVVNQIIEQGTDITSHYDDWRDIGFALKTFGEDGRLLFHKVSEQHPDYNYEITDRRFDEAIEKSTFTTPAKFFKIAKSHGIKLRMPEEAPEPTQAINQNVSVRSAAPEEDENDLLTEVRKEFTNAEIETLLSKETLDYLHWKDPNPRYEKATKSAYSKIAGIFKKCNWRSLINYSIVKNRKVKTYAATEDFPIYLIEEATDHKLIFQPKHPDPESRLLIFAERKSFDHIYGLARLDEEYSARKRKIEEENAAAEAKKKDSDDKKKRSEKDPRLEMAIFVRDCSDYINLTMLGYQVVWSEKENLIPTQYQYDQQLKKQVEKLYQVVKNNGQSKRIAHKMAMDYLDIYNIELREANKEGEPIVTVSDYLQYFSEYELKKVIEDSIPYRFWEKNYTQHGVNFEIENENLYNFLQKNGFYRMRTGDKKSEWCYVKIDGNTVTEVYVEDIKSYLKFFSRSRRLEKGLKRALFRSPQLNDSSLNNLDETDIDFTDCDKNSQYIFFRNKTIRVTADKVEVFNPGDVSRYIWDEELQPHNFKLNAQEPFTIKKDEFGTYDITVNNKDCVFLKYLVQTSRVHWRKELEQGEKIKAMSQDERNNYYIENHVNIAGTNLEDDEIEEQKRHLVNKIFTIGYLLHRYKDRKKPWFPYAMDDKIPEDGRSHGGSGKSILFDIAMRAMQRKNFYINGRNTKLNEDAFKYDGLTEHHRYTLIDDANEFLKLDLFFTDITGDIKVNPKGKKPYVIPFEKGCKFAFTSNFPPKNLDSSILRRILFVVFSDYYHTAGETNDYIETRDPGTDLGLTLFAEFTEEQWNDYYNTMAYCLRFYLTTNEKIGPAMDNVTKRNLISTMGYNFLDWALAYFSPEGENLDKMLVREEVFQDFKFHNPGNWTPQSFLERLKAYCRYQGYVLNPKEYLNASKKIIQKVVPKSYDKTTNTYKPIDGAKKTTKEMIYIHTQDELKTVEEEVVDDEMPF